MIVFLTHKINPKVFCPNFGVHFIKSSLSFIYHPGCNALPGFSSTFLWCFHSLTFFWYSI